MHFRPKSDFPCARIETITSSLGLKCKQKHDLLWGVVYPFKGIGIKGNLWYDNWKKIEIRMGIQSKILDTLWNLMDEKCFVEESWESTNKSRESKSLRNHDLLLFLNVNTIGLNSLLKCMRNYLNRRYILDLKLNPRFWSWWYSRKNLGSIEPSYDVETLKSLCWLDRGTTNTDLYSERWQCTRSWLKKILLWTWCLSRPLTKLM